MKQIQTFLLFILVVMACVVAGCGRRDRMSDGAGKDCALPDTFRVGTLYSPTSFFIYRGDSLGYDYDLVNRFAADKGMEVKLTVAGSLPRLIEMANEGDIDLIAYEVPVTAEYAGQVSPCGYENISTQVLVQPTLGSDTVITDVTQLIGREVWVERGSKYFHRLQNLNDELGGGIIIRPVDSDTIVTEDLIEMVASGAVPLTVADSDVAALNGTYFANIDYSMPLSLEQRASWAVAPDRQCLADSVNSWMKDAAPQEAQSC